MSQNNGGPAFPNQGGQKFTSGSQVRVTLPSSGMSLRDYFAASALSTCSAYSGEDVSTWEAMDFAIHAYRIADAMLAARGDQ